MTMRKHLNIFISDEMLTALDAAAAERGLDRSKFVRWALGRVLSEDEPYIYEPPTLPNWQTGAWTLLLRGLFGTEHLTLTGEVKALLAEAVAALNEREAQVLRLRFGLRGPRHTLEEVGAVLGFNRERARQVEAKALRRLHGWPRTRGIWELVKPQLEKEGHHD